MQILKFIKKKETVAPVFRQIIFTNQDFSDRYL